jgi:hypothetical protein
MPPQEVRDSSGTPRLGLRQDKYGYTWSFAGDGTPWWLALHVDHEGLEIQPDLGLGDDLRPSSDRLDPPEQSGLMQT